tara:strand:- start:224 stop:478 length:255 start_codon:yes stop_codon:yes gene_type:complete
MLTISARLYEEKMISFLLGIFFFKYLSNIKNETLNWLVKMKYFFFEFLQITFAISLSILLEFIKNAIKKFFMVKYRFILKIFII